MSVQAVISGRPHSGHLSWVVSESSSSTGGPLRGRARNCELLGVNVSRHRRAQISRPRHLGVGTESHLSATADQMYCSMAS